MWIRHKHFISILSILLIICIAVSTYLLYKQQREGSLSSNSLLRYFLKDSSNSESFLAYLPHSGLSNQRIELANALLLAALLNRTLIVPPAFLGSVVGWMPFEQLEDHLSWLTTPKDFDLLCRLPTPGTLSSYVQRSKCAEYHQFAAIRWDQLHDFTTLINKYNIHIRFQDTVSLAQLQKDLGLSSHDTYVHYDEHLYDWRLYEDVEEASSILANGSNFVDSFTDRKFYKIFTSYHFKNRTERLLHLGGVFGSTRMNMVEPAHIELQQQISETLHYRLDTPLGEAVANVVNHLGGKATYHAVHFRLRDMPFRKYATENMKQFERNMTIATGGMVPPLPPYDRKTGQLVAPSKPPPAPKYVVSVEPHQDLTQPPWSNVCRNLSPLFDNFGKENENGAAAFNRTGRDIEGWRTVVYIATDHRDIRGNHSRVLEWFDYFPCTVTLNDIPPDLLAPLDSMHCLFNPSKTLRSYLIPLVDAMVAAHGKRVLTTPRSTFSKYIGELNEAWVLKEQGLNASSFWIYPDNFV
ncbi:hypothetical protein BDF20DRAFT_883851 [Mycotypha africana]|uniref:uncharacterized protein n=1 Tax=Mycotypha africana TaxID=64632 RepID=UPI002301D230|nr:uncharacterized protein BDF20DRAFT_883851 [Mycotypha africana]KAI8973732.1 hypothetical protein BDF20DRAFT_883851 [Mycotypha africana]